jgi:hypothetical protein
MLFPSTARLFSRSTLLTRRTMSTTTTNYPVNPKYAEHARVATEAVLRAAFVTSKVQGGIKERKKDTEEKEDKSPVTG